MRAQFGDQDSFGDQVVSGDPRLILSLATPSSANSFHRIVRGGRFSTYPQVHISASGKVEVGLIPNTCGAQRKNANKGYP